MGLFKRKLPAIQPGCRFVKAGDPPSKAWVVTRVWETVDGIPHARLENCIQQSESRLVSISVLNDPEFFIPAAEPTVEP
ncbi:hypothetical protein [Magnetospirillum sp. ME-1]|uniref:hypothetical protein n=1 Tax=Magnetospirillum sp. ME-1 TaxID=1639348 RepID=UPI000A18FD0C|nr:hypothetical protein [Magnetospirillum sp. ME-1]